MTTISMTKKISKTTGATITNLVSHNVSGYGKLTTVCDALIADGHTDLAAYRAPAKGEDRTFYDSLLSYVVKGFPAEAQKLLITPAKELSEAEKELKSKWGRNKGREVGNIRVAMEARLKLNGGNGAQTPVSEEAQIFEGLAEIAKKAQKLKEPSFDVVTFNKHINAALKVVANKK